MRIAFVTTLFSRSLRSRRPAADVAEGRRDRGVHRSAHPHDQPHQQDQDKVLRELGSGKNNFN